MIGWALMVNALTMARHRATDGLLEAARPSPAPAPPNGDSACTETKCRKVIGVTGTNSARVASIRTPETKPGFDFCQDFYRPGAR
jgi:hypothetical protein